MKIIDVITRIGLSKTYNNFFSKESVEVLELLTNEQSTPGEKLLSYIKNNFPDDELLRSKKTRNLLLNSLQQDDAKELCSQLDITVSDNDKIYDMLTSKSFAKNSDNERILFEFFEAEFIEHEEVPKQSENIDIAKPDKELFDYQRRAIKEITSHLDGDKRRCLLHMPTGSGKTITAVHALTNFFLNNEPSLIIWLAYNEELCEQALNEFVTTWNRIGDRSIPIIKFFSQYSEDLLEKTRLNKEGFVIASLGKMHEADKGKDIFLSTLADRVDFVVMDEAHQALAPTYQNVLEQLVEKRRDKTRLLGLSATPGRATDQEGLDTPSLARFFHHNKVSLQINEFKNPVEYLINKGYVAKPNITIKKIDSDLTTEDLMKIEKSIDIPKNILEKLGKNSKRILLEINQIKSLINSGHKRIMVFGSSVENSRDISLILQVLGHISFHVDGNTSSQKRNQYVEKYKQSTNDTVIMCNFGVFTAGFDAPKTSAVLIARPTKSVVLYSQMAGRAMRGIKVGGTKECEIHTITDNRLVPFQNIVNNFLIWEDAW